MKFMTMRKLGFYSLPLCATALTAVTAFAETPATGSALTKEMLDPLVDGITANIGVIFPVGILIFAIMLGIVLVPKIIKKFF